MTPLPARILPVKHAAKLPTCAAQVQTGGTFHQTRGTKPLGSAVPPRKTQAATPDSVMQTLVTALHSQFP